MKNEKQIREAVEAFVSSAGSAGKAATKLGISAAHMSNLRNGRFDLVSEETLRTIQHKLGMLKEDWPLVETEAYKELHVHMGQCQLRSMTMAILAPAGAGKSKAIEAYESNHANAFVIKCAEFWNKKIFLQEILKSMGTSYEGHTTYELVSAVVDKLSSIDRPLLILDEADKMKDEVLYFFITIYNYLEDRCGIVMLSTDYFKKRISKGLNTNRKGYQEIYSRLGRRFVEIAAPGDQDIAMMCLAHGLSDHREISRIAMDSAGDLRRVKRHLQRFNEKKAKGVTQAA